ncbi:MAG: prephenate dehydratase [Gammaproteobacteria bacterium]|nr:prephenate dehydratase [Gammaproteobacteria bacterium]
MNKNALSELRKKIDEVDSKLLALLNERAQHAVQAAVIKQTEQSGDTQLNYRPERETRLLRNLLAKNQGPLADEHVEHLFRQVISCCRSLEDPLTIAYLGPKGTYTEAATQKQFGHFAATHPLPSIADVFREVAVQNCQYGVVPVENSTEGMVNLTLDCFMESDLRICGEVSLPIHHSLMVPRSLAEEDIGVIYSHEQSLAQCRQWLDSHLPEVDLVAVHSNAEAARLASSQERAAAIASEHAADLYGLRVLHSSIEDQSDNTTRFLVIGKQRTEASGKDKTTLLVATQNIPGALFKVLSPFQENEISLSRIESRPSKLSAWTYVFFIDFDGHESDPGIVDVLEEVRKVAVLVRVLGSYPKSTS